MNLLFSHRIKSYFGPFSLFEIYTIQGALGKGSSQISNTEGNINFCFLLGLKVIWKTESRAVILKL